MPVKIAALLKALKPKIASELICPRAWQAIFALAEQLPPVWNCGACELRLQPGQDQVDLSVSAFNEESGQQTLAALLASAAPLSILDPARQLLAEWSRPGSPLNQHLPIMWLEYDLPDGRCPPPFAYLSFDYDYYRPKLSLSCAQVCALIKTGLQLATGSEIDAGKLAMIERCLSLLPPGARLHHFAAFPQRGAEDLRVVVSLPENQVARWLTEIAWPGNHSALARLLRLNPGLERLTVQLNIGQQVNQYFAIELYLPGQPELMPRWREFFNDLVKLGICDAAKAKALLDWPGEEKVRLADADWLMKIFRLLYIKLNIDLDGPEAAKAYLHFYHRYVLL